MDFREEQLLAGQLDRAIAGNHGGLACPHIWDEGTEPVGAPYPKSGSTLSQSTQAHI